MRWLPMQKHPRINVLPFPTTNIACMGLGRKLRKIIRIGPLSKVTAAGLHATL